MNGFMMMNQSVTTIKLNDDFIDIRVSLDLADGTMAES